MFKKALGGGGRRMEGDRSKDKSFVIREQPTTYDDYASLDDGNRYEVVDGTLELMSPGPNLNHQVISFQIQKRLAETCEQNYLVLYAPIDLILSPTEVRQPDLVMIHRSRLHILSRRGIEGPPDLVVEILSPGTLRRDKIGKMKTYARFRIPEYWIVDPVGGSLERYELDETEERYSLTDIFIGEETVRSSRIACVSFQMSGVMKALKELPIRD
jgi:Uma2 family endonuclease